MTIFLDFISSLLYLIFGFHAISRINNKAGSKDILHLRVLLIYHLLFGFLYYLFTVNESVDSYTYWSISKNLRIDSTNEIFRYGLGTEMIYIINYLPFNVLCLSYFQGTLLYCYLGFRGMLFLFLAIKKTVPTNPYFLGFNLLFLLLFLPNMHFWSSGIGKDSLAFFCISYIIYLIAERKYFGLIVPMVLLYISRPHMVIFLALSIFVSIIIQKGVASYKKVILILVFLSSIGYVISIFNEFVNIDSLDFESIQQYSELKTEKLSEEGTNSRLDFGNAPIYIRLFTFLYRPLFFDITNFMGVIVSVENLLLLFLTIEMLRSEFIFKIRNSPYIIKCLFLFLLISSISFCLTLGNLGIMIRMKNMLMPSIILIFLSVLSIKGSSKN